ncbi:MAG: DUF924 domain-containing protein [Alphaproteobacteria bacterium]|nr:DUF924 domain-containing protein [Alphaproteobacteria bacterium]
MSAQAIASIILNFWFGEPNSLSYGRYKDFWFQSTPELDGQIRKQLEPVDQKAIKGELDPLSETPEGSLALVIILDQFPRNMYRGTPQAFASDAKALKVAKEAVEKKFDQDLLPMQRMFLYLPYEHSENIEDQEQSVKLFKNLGDELALKYAIEHRDAITQFGRFPHRNAILGRESTPEEIRFLGGKATP